MLLLLRGTLMKKIATRNKGQLGYYNTVMYQHFICCILFFFMRWPEPLIHFYNFLEKSEIGATSFHFFTMCDGSENNRMYQTYPYFIVVLLCLSAKERSLLFTELCAKELVLFHGHLSGKEKYYSPKLSTQIKLTIKCYSVFWVSFVIDFSNRSA